MNYTTNYNLPQWEDADRVTREAANGAVSAIDAAIAGKCSVLVGWYTGDGTDARIIDLGTKPKAVIVRQPGPIFGATAQASDIQYLPVMAIEGINCGILGIHANGFGVGGHELTNKSGNKYIYFAFV